jgi:hypothetical protein
VADISNSEHDDQEDEVLESGGPMSSSLDLPTVPGEAHSASPEPTDEPTRVCSGEGELTSVHSLGLPATATILTQESSNFVSSQVAVSTKLSNVTQSAEHIATSTSVQHTDHVEDIVVTTELVETLTVSSTKFFLCE